MKELIKSAAKNLPQKSPNKEAFNESTLKKATEEIKSFKKHGTTISLVVFVVLIVACLLLLKSGISIGAEALFSNYSLAYESEKDATFNELRQNAFDRSEKNYHVSNRVVISIGSLEKTGKLEVLKANGVEFITQDRDKNFGNVTAWLEVTGEGIFVVDFTAAEFIVDNDRRYVLVRIPYPELTNVSITNTRERWFKDDWKDGSYRDGVHLALKQRNEAILQIQKTLMSNQYIYSSAQDIAKSMIVNLVKQFNSEIPDMTVEVEFID